MLFNKTVAAGGVEILVGLTDMHTLTPIKVATPTASEGEEVDTVVKAGTPLTSAGASTTGSGAVGILLYDVDTAENPNGTIVQSGPIDSKKAQAHSGVTYVSALYTALPAVQFRTDIGVNEKRRASMDIRKLFTPAEIAANWEEVYSNQIPYLGAGLFPSKKKAGLDLSWFKGTKGLPVSLMPSAFDAQATFRDRIGLEKLEAEMPFFREGFKIKEKDRQELLRVAESNDPYAEAILARLYDDANELIAGADVVAERMRMQLLFPASGNLGIAIKANGVDYTYNYDPDGSWKSNNYFALTGNALWSATSSADPFADIEKVQDAIRSNTGAEVTTVVLNSTTFNLLAKIDAVKNRFLSTAGITTGYITKGDVQGVFRDTNGVRFAIYDKMYRNEDKTAAKFVPDGYVALVPDGALGSTWYGTTPEEADGASAPMDVAIVNTGVAVSRIVEPHPVNVNTIASEIVLPSYERADEVALLKVTA